MIRLRMRASLSLFLLAVFVLCHWSSASAASSSSSPSSASNSIVDDLTDNYSGTWTLVTRNESLVVLPTTSVTGTLLWTFKVHEQRISTVNATTYLAGFPISATATATAIEDDVRLVSGYIGLRDGRYASDATYHVYFVGALSLTTQAAAIVGLPTRAAAEEVKAKLVHINQLAQYVNVYAPTPGSSSSSSSSSSNGDSGSGSHDCTFWSDNIQFVETGIYRDPYIPYDSAEYDRKVFSLRGKITSPSCGVALELTSTSFIATELFSKATLYAALVGVACCFQLWATVRQSVHASSPAAASRVSVLGIGTQTLMDSYICLFHLLTALVVPGLFLPFAACAFLQFLLFSVFEMRSLLTSWRAQAGVANEAAVRWEFSGIYSRFYAIVFLGIFLLYNLAPAFKVIVFILYLFWVPQIARNAWSNTKRPLDPLYVFTMTVTRLLLPAYFFFVADNFLDTQPAPEYFMLLAGSVFLQAAVLLMQHIYGPRFFVPDRFLPHRYNYFRTVPLPDEELGENARTCVICMHDLDPALVGSRHIMVTPCSHMFHTECLMEWTEIKLECPTCRALLPEP